MRAHLRIARPTDRLDQMVSFYRDLLGFELIGEFFDHSGFDGVMLGHPDLPYHFEFTRQHGVAAGGAPSPEHLLVFYLPEEAVWQQAVARLSAAGREPVAPHNPYWAQQGLTYLDPDGYRIVLQRADWPPRP